MDFQLNVCTFAANTLRMAFKIKKFALVRILFIVWSNRAYRLTARTWPANQNVCQEIPIKLTNLPLHITEESSARGTKRKHEAEEDDNDG